MSKGKSVACNRSNEINEILANEATENSSVNVKYTNELPAESLFKFQVPLQVIWFEY